MKINELRRSSGINPRLNGVAQFMNYINNITAKDMRRTFVSFTTLDKLGINPSSTYATPLGIYAYPADYVRRMVNRYCGSHDVLPKDIPGFDKVVPFAGHTAFMNVFQVSGNVIDLADDEDCSEAIQAVNDTFDLHGIDLPDAYEQSTISSTLWSKTLFVALGKRSDLDKVNYEESRQAARRWTTVFRKSGIDGVIDSEGFGVIHENEPTQAVFFNPSIIKNNKRFVNSAKSGSDSKQPLQHSKVGYYFAKQILKYGVVAEIKPLLYRSLYNHVLSYVMVDHEEESSKAIDETIDCQQQVTELMTATWKKSGLSFKEYDSMVEGVLDRVSSNANDWVKPYELHGTSFDDMEAVRKKIKEYTDKNFNETFRRFVQELKDLLQEKATKLTKSNTEFAKWLDKVIPDKLKDGGN